MYCKTCGAENPESAIYCVNDGALLKSYPLKYRKKENTSTFCSSCGGKVSAQSNYCENCGEGLIKYGRETNILPKIPMEYAREVTPKTVKLPAFQLHNLKRAVIPALIAIVVVFILSFLMLQSTGKLYTGLMSGTNNEYDINQLIDNINSEAKLSIPKVDKPIGVTDILMWANLQNPNLTVKASGDLGFIGNGQGSLDFFIKNGFFIYLLIPFIGLFAAGIYAGRKTRGADLLNRLADAVGIAIIYAVFCMIVSFFAGFSFNTSIKQMGISLSLDINTHYSFFKTLLMCLLIGFLFSGFGILFATDFRKMTGHLREMVPFGEAIHQAIAVPFRGILILFVIIFAVLASKVSSLKDQLGGAMGDPQLAALFDKSYGLICSLAMQLGTYVWNLLHLTSLSFAGSESGQQGSLALHLFNGVHSSGQFTDSEAQMIEGFLTATDVGTYLKLALLIPIALLVWAGIRIAKQPNVIKNLVIFSVVYAVIMMGIASFSDIGFSFNSNGNGNTESVSMMLGFSPFITFICSLILSFIFAYAGTWIHKFRTKQ